jgi:hypothetical protein
MNVPYSTRDGWLNVLNLARKEGGGGVGRTHCALLESRSVLVARTNVNSAKMCFGMSMSYPGLISYDLGHRTAPYVTSHRGHCPLLIRISCIT